MPGLASPKREGTGATAGTEFRWERRGIVDRIQQDEKTAQR
jgi:hypothetical protein